MLLRIFVFDPLCDPITNSRRRNKGRYLDCYLSACVKYVGIALFTIHGTL